MNRSLKIIFWATAAIVLIAAVALIGKGAYERRMRKIDVDIMQIVAEDVLRRVNDAIRNRQRLDELCATLSAGKKDDVLKTATTEAMRYIDTLEIVNVDKIAASTRVGRKSTVSIIPNSSRETKKTTDQEFYIGRMAEDGERPLTLETITPDWKVIITVPCYGSALADDCNYYPLVYGTMALAALLFIGLSWMMLKRGISVFAEAMRLAFSGSRRSARRRSWSRIIWVEALILVLGASIAWVVSDMVALRHAKVLMDHSAAEIENDIISSVDDLLFYVGNAIVRHYKTPQAMTSDTVKEIMHRYDIDELNIVDERGIVLAGDLANEGFDFNSTPNTQKFLRLLKGANYYAQPFRSAVEDPNIVRKYAGVAFDRNLGFVQLGFDRKRMNGDVDYKLSKICTGWTVGERGYAIIARRSTGEILSCGHPQWSGIISGAGSQTLAEIGFNIFDIPAESGKMFEQNLYGQDVQCIALNVGEYHRLVVVVPLEQIKYARRFTVITIASILVLVLVIVAFIMRFLSNSNERLQQLIDEDRQRQAEDTKRRAEELENAKAIQTQSLPQIFPNERNFSIGAKMITAREVGGDFYDFYRVPSGKLLFLIADTSGKGIPAAMFMMKARAIIKACVYEYATFAECIVEANDRLSDNNDASMFVTAWIGLYDEITGTVEYINAGHNAPLVMRASGDVEWIRSHPGLALAAMSGVKYRVERFRLEPGDRLFLYTDGVNEAMNANGELFGDDRLKDTLCASQGRDTIVEVERALAEFVAGAEQSDDITMLVFNRR